jgi:Mn2+/Fe2+ NRAMP family transporter
MRSSGRYWPRLHSSGINREIGRYAVSTGASVIEGFAQLRGPRNWALWIILVPQAFVAITAIAGLAGSAATALLIVLPGDLRLWMALVTVASMALVVWGRYKRVELVATLIACTLAFASIGAAIAVGPDSREVLSGLTVQIPVDADYAEILPWLGFMLSGAAGLMWYTYWITAKGTLLPRFRAS